MEILPCVTHNSWENMVGPCDACYLWALSRSTMSSDNMSWGDVLSFREDYLESLKSPEEKAAEEAAKKKATEEMVVNAHLCHVENAYVNRKGQVKKISVPCRYFCHQGNYGVPAPAGNGWIEGCHAHTKGICPAIHPDEPDWDKVVAADKVRKAGGKTWRH